MSVYLYRAKKGVSQFQEGQVEALSREEALAKIDSLGLFLVSVEEKKSSKKKSLRVSSKELVEFTSQLSTLINSGSTLLAALNTLTVETEHASLRPIILDAVAQVKEGRDFSQALEKYPRIFPELYVSLVKIGEASGTLGENLRRIAEFLEEEIDFKSNIISILTYPLLIVGVGIATIFIILKFVIPALEGIFEEMSLELPAITLFLVNASRFFSRFWIFILGFILLVFMVLRRNFRNPSNRLKWDEFRTRIPLLGELLKKIELCRFTRTLSVLLKNGLALDASLGVITQTASNLFFRSQIGKAAREIEEGASLSGAMKKSSMFNSSFTDAIAVGENSGTLEKVLEVLSYDYNKDINRKMKKFLNLLEPLLILGVGLIVFFVVLSMFLPILQLDFNF